ncbi:MAG: HPP family protein [Pseudomonadota bacterium]|nr:HPP family protein [Pseudomonadota bacterium]
MSRGLLSWRYMQQLLTILPSSPHMSWAERGYSVLGALLGLSLSALLSHWLLGELAIWFVAPMGASAVLLFAVPSSPLAQPWSVIGGNTVSACVGVSCLLWLDLPLWLLAGLAGSLAIAAMLLCRCLHPPGGAVALTAVLNGVAVQRLGYQFVLTPVAINSMLMVLVALGFNRLVGRSYPQRQVAALSPHHTRDPRPSVRTAFDVSDVKSAFEQQAGFLDIGVHELEKLFQLAKAQAFERRYQLQQRCGDLMSRDVVVVQLTTPLHEALQVLQAHQLSALPVVDTQHQLQGWLRLADFLVLRGQSIHVLQPETDYWAKQVCDILRFEVESVQPDQPLTDLIPWFSDLAMHHMAVTDTNGVLLGVITQSDLIAALYHAKILDEI